MRMSQKEARHSWPSWIRLNLSLTRSILPYTRRRIRIWDTLLRRSGKGKCSLPTNSIRVGPCAHKLVPNYPQYITYLLFTSPCPRSILYILVGNKTIFHFALYIGNKIIFFLKNNHFFFLKKKYSTVSFFYFFLFCE